MIHTINITALMFGIVGVFVFNLRARSLFSAADAQIQKYKLFQIRDRLIRLVAEEKLSEDDFVFFFFYRAIDFLIRHTDLVNLKSLVDALRDAQERGLDPAAAQEVERINKQLKDEDPEVREVVSEFYATVMQILIENSFTIRLIANYSEVWNHAVNEFRRLIGRVFSTERQAYGFYKAYKNAVHITAQAA
jgi:dsDNA-specific endonuclease/ATPase MutS2